MTEEIKMLPIRQKQIVDLILETGFERTSFTFNPYSNEWFDLHLNSNRLFFIKFHNHKFSRRPGVAGQFEQEDSTPGWDANLKHLKSWLIELQTNLQIGNPWEELTALKEEFTGIRFDSYEELMNDADKNVMRVQFDLILLKLSDLEVETSQVQKDLSHLMEMSGKISKKDILIMLIGYVTSWVFNQVIPQDSIPEFISYIKHLFNHLKGLLIA